MKKITFVDLFAGVGGFHWGLKDKAECLLAVEINSYARQTYTANYQKVGICDDITLVDTKDIPDHDILCAGFPCQPFSIAGSRKGFNDCRGTLFFEILRILKDKKTPIALLENVKNLVVHNKGNTLRTIINSLKELGYIVYAGVMNLVTHANLPQNRERIFIVGFLKDKVKQAKNFIFPDPIPLTRSFRELLSDKVQAGGVL